MATIGQPRSIQVPTVPIAQYAYHNLNGNSRNVTTLQRSYGALVRAVRSGCSGLSQYTITANVAAGQSAMGSVSGGGTHCQYTRTTLRATPNSGYRFTDRKSTRLNSSHIR